MSVKQTVRRQNARLVDQTMDQLSDLSTPKQGWIATLRTALGLSGTQLAKRVGVTRAAIYQAERNESAGAITLRQMQKLADAMGARVVYAIIPNDKVEAVIRAQATKKAESVIRRASAHMALENQSLSPKHNQEEMERLADELVRGMPSDLWDPDDV